MLNLIEVKCLGGGGGRWAGSLPPLDETLKLTHEGVEFIKRHQ